MKVLLGIDVSTSAGPDRDPVADAVRAESLGYDFISANDHPGGAAPSFETWTLLTWIAARTERIQMATRVLGVPYRSPAIVAKMAASLDRLSGGRLILGMGAGYSDDEFRAFGLGVPTPKEKVEGLEEAVRIVRGLWTEPSFSFTGRHHRVENAELEPKPRRHIPIWLGTFKSRSLAVTGRVADGWIPSLDMAPPEMVPSMKSRIFEAAESAGRAPSDITLAYNIDFRIGDGHDKGPGILSGAPDEMVERLRGFVALGFSAFNFVPSGPGRAEQVEALARDVLDPLRQELGSSF